MAAPNAYRDPGSRGDSSSDAAKSPAPPNPHDDKERWRLAWHYGELSDAELESLAAEAASLTEVARRALQSELARRHLAVEPQAPAAAAARNKTAAPRQLVTVRRFRDMPEALLAKSVLESAGIDCALADANIIRTDWLWSNMLGGIKLRVSEDDFEAASNLLDQDAGELHDATGDPVGIGFAEAACPNCHSLDISCEDLRASASASASAASAGPIVIPSRRGDAPYWTCHSCGHRWQDADSTA